MGVEEKETDLLTSFQLGTLEETSTQAVIAVVAPGPRPLGLAVPGAYRWLLMTTMKTYDDEDLWWKFFPTLVYIHAYLHTHTYRQKKADNWCVSYVVSHNPIISFFFGKRTKEKEQKKKKKKKKEKKRKRTKFFYGKHGIPLKKKKNRFFGKQFTQRKKKTSQDLLKKFAKKKARKLPEDTYTYMYVCRNSGSFRALELRR